MFNETDESNFTMFTTRSIVTEATEESLIDQLKQDLQAQKKIKDPINLLDFLSKIWIPSHQEEILALTASKKQELKTLIELLGVSLEQVLVKQSVQEALSTVKKNPLALKKCKDVFLCEHPEIVEMALNKNPMVLEFVPHHIPNYREIVKLAVIKDIGALRHASSELLNDDLFLVSMIKEHPELFDRIKASSRQDPEVLKQLTDFSTDPVFKTSFTETQIKACLTPTSIPDTITDVTTAPEWPTESQKESLLALLKARAIDGTTIYAALPPSLRTDTAWALACVQENHSCLTSIIKTLPKSTIELFLIQAFKQSNETNREALFDLFPDEFKNDASFMIQCLGYRQIIIHRGDYDDGITLNEKQGTQDKGDVYLFKKNGQWILAFDSPEDTCLEKNLSNHTKLLELLT